MPLENKSSFAVGGVGRGRRRKEGEKLPEGGRKERTSPLSLILQGHGSRLRLGGVCARGGGSLRNEHSGSQAIKYIYIYDHD